MPIHLQFTLTLEDYMHGQRLHAKKSWWPRLNYFLCLYGYPALGLAGILLAIYLFRTATPLYVATGALGASLVLIGYRPYALFQLKRCYRRTRVGTGERTNVFDEASIRTESANTKGEIQWSAVRSISEDKNILLIYIAEAMMFMIPKRICPEPQLTELRELCQRSIAARNA
jgi:hypothetical protein